MVVPLKNTSWKCIKALVLLLLGSAIAEPCSFAIDKPATHDGASKKLLIVFSGTNATSNYVRKQIIESGPAADVIRNSYQLIQVEQGMGIDKTARYKIASYPTIIIAHADGTEIDRLVGLRKPEDAAKMFKIATQGKSELSHLREHAQSAEAGIRAHLTLAEALRYRDDLEGALNEYKWILDNGALVDPKGFMSVYRSVIAGIAYLSRLHAPAREELIKRRDLTELAINGNVASVEVIAQIFMLNEALGQELRNVPIYLKIPTASPLKQTLYPNIFPFLIEAGKYEEASAIADLEDFVGSLYPHFRFASGHHAHDGHDHSIIDRAQSQKIATWTLAACEALIALGELEKAKRVTGRALDYLGQDNAALFLRLETIAFKCKETAPAFGNWLENYSNK